MQFFNSRFYFPGSSRRLPPSALNSFSDKRYAFLHELIVEMTENLAIFLSDPIHVVGQEPEVGINCSHVCVRAPLRLAFEVDCNIVDFQPHGPTPQTLYLPSCSVISSLTALGPQTSSYPEIGPPLPYLMYCLLHSSVISFSNTRLRNW